MSETSGFKKYSIFWVFRYFVCFFVFVIVFVFVLMLSYDFWIAIVTRFQKMYGDTGLGILGTVSLIIIWSDDGHTYTHTLFPLIDLDGPSENWFKLLKVLSVFFAFWLFRVIFFRENIFLGQALSPVWDKISTFSLVGSPY